MKLLIRQFTERPFLSSITITVSELFINYSLLLFITHLFEASVVGKWFLFLAVYNVSINIREGVLYASLVKFSSGKEADVQYSSFKTVFVSLLLIEGIIGSIILAVGLFNLFPEISSLLVLYPIYSITNNSLKWIENIHKSNRQLHKTVLINIFTIICLGLLCYGLWQLQQPKLEDLIWGLSGMYTVVFFLSLSTLPIFKIIKSKFNPKTFKQIIFYAKQGTLKAIFGTIASRMTLFISAGLLSLEVTAVLGLAQRYLIIILALGNSIQLIFYPKIVVLFESGQLNKFKNEFKKTLVRVYSLILPLSLIFMIVIKPIIIFLHGEVYADAYYLLVILILSSLFNPLGAFFGSYTNAIGKPQHSTNVVVLNSCILIVSSYFFIHFLGELGTVLPSLFTEFIGFILITYYFIKRERINIVSLIYFLPKCYAIYFRKGKQILFQYSNK
ncbi:polysaccharide biosynthesis C-terminal domain-containing protein [Flammeovirga sp. SubArs3]|uniref:polysaccharide biosynthesis C-terminal domain-containing protein n=1 Tax=Flammeovirga sp. SubArs3 TaxID=2995316 RepID=UPI00248ADF2F|nr:polysaccharide biosynthesis C-terminal domain-containing protein [Flammeovirga sp. SubArs3]